MTITALSTLAGAARALFSLRARPAAHRTSGHAALQVTTVTPAGTHTVLVGRTAYGKGHAPASPVTPPTIIEGCIGELAATPDVTP